MAAVTVEHKLPREIALALQCGRGAMAAVTTAAVQPARRALPASMWPRRDGRGDWARGKPSSRARRLQCGRGAMAAVTRGLGDIRTACARASMWPRRDGRGDRTPADQGAHRLPASMWPRRDGRGDLNFARVDRPPELASMWPRRDGRGDLAAGGRDPKEVAALQCGRGAMAAVTTTRIPASRRRCRFNVAAARWPR